MTIEEASIIIGNIPINGDGCYSIPEYQQAKAIAIKSLESLEKIKEEIWDYIQYNYDIKGANECNKIFDKYLKEKEE